MWEAILGGLASGAMGLLGSSMTNAANANQAANAMNFSGAQTAAQMAFQEHMYNRTQVDNARVQERNLNWQDIAADRQMAFQRNTLNTAMAYNTEMANTQMQRRMDDLRAAGLNPMLAYTQGGAAAPSIGGASGAMGGGSSFSASPPSGASAHGSMARMENVLGSALTSAARGAEVVQGLRAVAAQIDQTEANTDRIRAETRNVDVNTGLQTAQTITETNRPDLVRAEVGRARAQTGLTNVQTGRQVEELRDYRNWGPPSVIRDPLVTGERIGDRVSPSVGAAGRAAGEAMRGASEAARNSYRVDPRSWQQIIEDTVLRYFR